MSEARRSVKCLACGAVAWTDGVVPAACPACGEPGRMVSAAALEAAAEGTPYVMPDGASILKE